MNGYTKEESEAIAQRWLDYYNALEEEREEAEALHWQRVEAQLSAQ